MEQNQRIVLASRPTAWVEESNFRLEQAPIPEPGPEQVLVRNRWLSLDPYMRGRMSDAKSYAKPVEIGEVMVGGAAGEVVKSNHPGFAPGDAVVGALGWQTHAVTDGKLLQKVDARAIPLSAYLGPVGMPGVTAWVGLNDICAPKAGETVVVTAASGAVGSVHKVRVVSGETEKLVRVVVAESGAVPAKIELFEPQSTGTATIATPQLTGAKPKPKPSGAPTTDPLRDKR